MSIDLFWEPKIGDKVRWKKCALKRHGGLIGSDGPHTVVRDAGTLTCAGESFRMFWITADGPITFRTDAKGRRHEIRPTSQSPACLDDIEPVES